MEERRRQYHKMNYMQYMDGNAVRKLEVAEEIAEPYERPERRQEPSIAPKKKKHTSKGNARAIRGMDTVMVCFLTVAICITGFMCVKFLETQAKLTCMNSQISDLQKEIVALKEENTTEKNAITAQVDLDDIYKTATKKLGMVHPKKSQIITYKSTKSDTVQQYGDIPDDKKKGLLESILGGE
ncbi:MAG: hypothetical protein II073_08280 [Lachnospiraceae bacterium]|nr:hypothetical protein [Lachnospiraceae bacterium]